MPSALATLRTWGEMIKFSHSVFALPLALLATFLAARPALPTPHQFGLIVVCMVAARSAAMTFNRIADRHVDAANPRTAGRALPRGRISLPAAWAFYIGSAGLFILGCVGFQWLVTPPNPWPLRLGLPVLAWLCLYSYTKRFTAWSHVLLGLGIAFAPVAAWIAIRPATLGPPAWLLCAAGTFWIGGFDLIYACQDVAFDRAAGLRSVPARLGVPAALWLARVFHAVTCGALLAVGLTAGLGGLYDVGVACVAVLLFIEHLLVRPHDLRRVNLAFFTVNGIVSVVLGVLGILDVVLT